MGSVATNLATMGTGQVLLASVLLGSYALALGRFVGNRGRLVAIATSILAAAGFVALSEPWEAGVIVIAFVPFGMGLLPASPGRSGGWPHEPLIRQFSWRRRRCSPLCGQPRRARCSSA